MSDVNVEELATEQVTNMCSPLFADASAIAGICHSYPDGGNSSQLDPVVNGSSCSHTTTPCVGAVVHAVKFVSSDAGAEKSCGTGTGVAVDPSEELPGRHSWNSTLLPAAAVVETMLTRTPTAHARNVVAATTECSGVAVDALTVTIPDRHV
jgi:hypothetical protein